MVTCECFVFCAYFLLLLFCCTAQMVTRFRVWEQEQRSRKVSQPKASPPRGPMNVVTPSSSPSTAGRIPMSVLGAPATHNSHSSALTPHAPRSPRSPHSSHSKHSLHSLHTHSEHSPVRPRQLIVAVTANGGEIGGCGEQGFDEICPKPLTKNEIYRIISRYFQ